MTADPFEMHTSMMLEAIQLCCAKGLAVPGLTLLYAAMDGMAWLVLPEGTQEVKRKDFESWADKYFVPEMRARGYSDITADDLYAARCALVHTQTAEALLTREPVKSAAREIYY